MIRHIALLSLSVALISGPTFAENDEITPKRIAAKKTKLDWGGKWTKNLNNGVANSDHQYS